MRCRGHRRSMIALPSWFRTKLSHLVNYSYEDVLARHTSEQGARGFIRQGGSQDPRCSLYLAPMLYPNPSGSHQYSRITTTIGQKYSHASDEGHRQSSPRSIAG